MPKHRTFSSVVNAGKFSDPFADSNGPLNGLPIDAAMSEIHSGDVPIVGPLGSGDR